VCIGRWVCAVGEKRSSYVKEQRVPTTHRCPEGAEIYGVTAIQGRCRHAFVKSLSNPLSLTIVLVKEHS